MNINISDLKAKARGNLANRYATIIVAYMIARLLTNIPSLLLSSMKINNILLQNLFDLAIAIIVAFISAIFVVGQNYICLLYARTCLPIQVEEMWYGFKGNTDQIIICYFGVFIRMFMACIPFFASFFMLMNDLSNIFWMVTTIVTSLISICLVAFIALNYAFVLYLIIDYPDEKPAEILKKSKTIMKGYRIKLGLLQLSFIGMYILSFLSFGIGFFWVYPYVKMTTTEFYLAVISNHRMKKSLEGDPSDPNYYKEVY